MMARQSVRDYDNNATVDANWSVAGMDIQSGYLGTVTLDTDSVTAYHSYYLTPPALAQAGAGFGLFSISAHG